MRTISMNFQKATIPVTRAQFHRKVKDNEIFVLDASYLHCWRYDLEFPRIKFVS